MAEQGNWWGAPEPCPGFMLVTPCSTTALWKGFPHSKTNNEDSLQGSSGICAKGVRHLRHPGRNHSCPWLNCTQQEGSLTLFWKQRLFFRCLGKSPTRGEHRNHWVESHTAKYDMGSGSGSHGNTFRDSLLQMASKLMSLPLCPKQWETNMWLPRSPIVNPLGSD